MSLILLFVPHLLSQNASQLKHYAKMNLQLLTRKCYYQIVLSFYNQLVQFEIGVHWLHIR